MLKSCKYCGKVHDSRYDCGRKPVRRKKIRTTQNSFRSTQAWKQKSLEIRERDHYLCQVCLRNLYGTISRYNNRQIEVHHIVPLRRLQRVPPAIRTEKNLIPHDHICPSIHNKFPHQLFTFTGRRREKGQHHQRLQILSEWKRNPIGQRKNSASGSREKRHYLQVSR